MDIATGVSTQQNEELAMTEAYKQLRDKLGHSPQFIMLYASATYRSDQLVRLVREHAPQAAICGGTSCRGVMTETGFHSADGTALGLFGIYDPQGSYGVGAVAQGQHPRQAAAEAVTMALSRAQRDGEVPDLVWITGSPGHEEQLLLGIEDVLGPDVPIVGGSSADNTVSGEWQQFADGQIFKDAVVVAVMFPSTNTSSAFHSGYTPTDSQGRVTRAQGRTIYEIDGRPAAEVYNEWAGGIINACLPQGGNILGMTTLHPLGRVVGEIASVPYYKLSHPDSVTNEQAITLFSDIQEGDTVVLMTGNRDSLINRAGRVARSAREKEEWRAADVHGALVVYCAGCMLPVQDDMDQAAQEIRRALDGKPFLGMFTFGEQGCFVGGENRHGNLMISSVVFGPEHDNG